MANKGAREIEIFQQFSLLIARSITWGWNVNTFFCHLCSQARNGSEAEGEKGRGIIMEKDIGWLGQSHGERVKTIQSLSLSLIFFFNLKY